MIDFDKLRQAVFLKHDVALSRDDPVLITITLSELVLAHYVEILTARNVAQQAALTATLQTQAAQAKETAGRVITEAASYVSDQARQAVTEALVEARDQLQRDVAALRPAAPPPQPCRSLTMTTVTLVTAFAAGVLTTLAVALVLMAR